MHARGSAATGWAWRPASCTTSQVASVPATRYCWWAHALADGARHRRGRRLIGRRYESSNPPDTCRMTVPMHRYSRFLPQPKASHTALRRLGVVLAIVVAGDVLALLVGRRGLLAVGPMLIDSLLVGLLAAQALVPIAHAG